MSKIEFINTITNTSTDVLNISLPNLTDNENSQITSNTRNNILIKCNNNEQIINNVLSILSLILEKKYLIHIYNILYVYLSYKHEYEKIDDYDHIADFVNKHITFVNNNIRYKLYKNDILNIYTGYKYTNYENIMSVILTTNGNLSILNSIINPTELYIFNDLYITIICNNNCEIDINNILFKNYYI